MTGSKPENITDIQPQTQPENLTLSAVGITEQKPIETEKKEAQSTPETQPKQEIELKSFQRRIRAFLIEYCVDFNGRRAYKATHPKVKDNSAGTLADKILKRVDVKAYIEQELAKRAEKNKITERYVLDGLQEIAERCMQHRQVLTRSGKPVIVKDKEGNDIGAAFTFEPIPAKQAFELMGKQIGMFVDKSEVKQITEVIEIKKLTPEQAEKMAEVEVGDDGKLVKVSK